MSNFRQECALLELPCDKPYFMDRKSAEHFDDEASLFETVAGRLDGADFSEITWRRG